MNDIRKYCSVVCLQSFAILTVFCGMSTVLCYITCFIPKILEIQLNFMKVNYKLYKCDLYHVLNVSTMSLLDLLPFGHC